MEDSKKISSDALEKIKNNATLQNLRKELHICVDCGERNAEHRQLPKGFICQGCMNDEADRVLALLYCDASFFRRGKK